MYQFIFDQATSQGKWCPRIFNALRKWLSFYKDPIVHYTLNGRRIALPFSHLMPALRRQHTLYLANLGRLAGFIRRRAGILRMVDVGANVGDSYCIVDPQPGDAFLLIEGEASFAELLKLNTRNDPNVICVEAFLSDHAGKIRMSLNVQEGNASLVGINTIPGYHVHNNFSTLDEIVQMNTKFKTSNLLKTDVEGYDSKVLRGGHDFLVNARPTILFEYHPTKMGLIGEDKMIVFKELGELGYNRFLLYDNLGYLVCTLRGHEQHLISDLAAYGRQKRHYYDICCFNDQDKGALEDFLAEENDFYSAIASKSDAHISDGNADRSIF